MLVIISTVPTVLLKLIIRKCVYMCLCTLYACQLMLTYSVCVCVHGLLVFIYITLNYIKQILCGILSPSSARVHHA